MTTGLGQFLSTTFGGAIIYQRPSDGYIDATAMCKVQQGKRIEQWNINKDTQAFLDTLSNDMGISSIESTTDGSTSWIHPEAAIHLAMWLDPKIALQVVRWTARCISGDLTLMSELAAQHVSLNPQHTTFVTVTTGGPGIKQDAVSLLHQDNVMAHEDDNSTVRIAEVKVNVVGEEELHIIAKLKADNH